MTRQTYYYTDAAPRMKTDDSGAIYIAGGGRHVSPDDVPPPSLDVPLTTEMAPTNR